MSKEQIFTISEDGTIKTLRSKSGLDLREVGPVSVKRVSEIEFDTDRQKWFTHLLDPDRLLTAHMLASLDIPLNTSWDVGADGVLYFNDYDEAVEAEVMYFNSKALEGAIVIEEGEL